MIIHRINHESRRIQSSEVAEEDLGAIVVGDQGHTLLSLVQAGQPTFYDGHWLFGTEIMTRHGMQPTAELELIAGYQPHNGSNGNCDAHWIEVRQLVHRSACAIGRALELNPAAVAGEMH